MGAGGAWIFNMHQGAPQKLTSFLSPTWLVMSDHARKDEQQGIEPANLRHASDEQERVTLLRARLQAWYREVGARLLESISGGAEPSRTARALGSKLISAIVDSP